MKKGLEFGYHERKVSDPQVLFALAEGVWWACNAVTVHSSRAQSYNRSGWIPAESQQFSQYKCAHPQSLLNIRCRREDGYVMASMDPSLHVLCLAV